MLLATLVAELTKQPFPLQAKSDVTNRFISLGQCIKKDKALFHHHWLLGYPLKRAPAVLAGAYISQTCPQQPPSVEVKGSLVDRWSPWKGLTICLEKHIQNCPNLL